jgi:hypothetical protein
MGCTYGVVLRKGNAVLSKNVKLGVLARYRGGVVLAITAVAAAVQVA